MNTRNHCTARSKSSNSTMHPAITVYISESRWDTAGGVNGPLPCVVGLVNEGFHIVGAEVLTFAADTPAQCRTYRFTCCPPTARRYLWVRRLQRLAERLCCGSMEVDEENREIGQIGGMLEIA